MIHLVGAGPGDPGLLTVRALELIRQADVVVYDALVSDEIMALVRAEARKIYVGKRGREGSAFQSDPPARTVTTRHAAATSQDAINRLLVTEGSTTSSVIVRLKGGDPFVFGRGGEEALALAAAGLPFDVIPGISSAIAVPAYAGIPVTHRGMADSVTFITGMRDPSHGADILTRGPEFAALAQLKGTLVFMMSASKIEEISAELIRLGRDPETPAAVIQWGTRSNQRSVVSTLAHMAEKAASSGISSPAVFIIGEVVQVRQRINWFESRPLFGKRVVVTRARNDDSRLARMLRDRGAAVLEAPGVALKRLPADDLDRELRALNRYTDIIFTSQNAVGIVADRLEALELDGRAFAGLKISAIGSSTAEKIRSAMGLRVDIVPGHATGEGLCAALGDPANRRFLFPRAKDARDVIVKHLGDAVNVVPVYEAIPADMSELRGCLDKHDVDAILFGSAAAVKNFMSSAGERALLDGVPLVSIGPITSAAIVEHGFEPVTARASSLEGLVAACEEALSRP